MIKHQKRVLKLCKELLADINEGTDVSPKSNVTVDTELCSVFHQIYRKYFEKTVLGLYDVSNKEEICNAPFLGSLQKITNQSSIILPSDDDVWIFGYGSLVWKADFPFIDRRKGFIPGYQRRFYQNSTDHRGTVESPGRVVTLLPTAQLEDRVYGIAYRIAAQQRQHVLDHLDYREKNGYMRCSLEFHEFPEETCDRFDVVMYVANAENESYAGDVWQQQKIAEQIVRSAGPSGTNREYIFNLANAMRMLFPGVEDEHLFNLERNVVQIIKENETSILERAVKREILSILIKAIELGDQMYKEEDVDVKTKLLEEFQKLRDRCTNPSWKNSVLLTDNNAG